MKEKEHVKPKPTCKNKKDKERIDFKKLMEENNQVDGSRIKGRY